MAALGLCCYMQDLWSSLWSVGSLVVTHRILFNFIFYFSCSMHNLLVAVCGIQLPNQGSNPGPCIGAWSFIPWATREVPEGHFKKPSQYWLSCIGGQKKKYLKATDNPSWQAWGRKPQYPATEGKPSCITWAVLFPDRGWPDLCGFSFPINIRWWWNQFKQTSSKTQGKARRGWERWVTGAGVVQERHGSCCPPSSTYCVCVCVCVCVLEA